MNQEPDDLSLLKEMMEHMESTPAPVEQNQLGQLVAEIKILSQQTAANIIEIGKRLIDAKAQVGHGNWERWLGDNLELSTRRAQQFMKVAEEYGNANTYSFLTPSKAIALLDLPVSDREEFVANIHEVNGQQKTVDEMSTRELAEAIRAKKEADGIIQSQAKKLQASEKDLEDLRIKDRNSSSLLSAKEAQLAKLQEDNKKLIQKLAQSAPPITVEKEVIPEWMQKALDQAKSENAILSAELSAKQSSGERRDDIAMRVDFFTNRITSFVRDMSSLGYLGPEFTRTSPQAQKKYAAAINALEKLCSDLRDVAIIPRECDVIEIEAKEVS